MRGVKTLNILTLKQIEFFIWNFGLTHYSMVLFIPPENTREPLGFLIFSGDTDKQQRTAIG